MASRNDDGTSRSTDSSGSETLIAAGRPPSPAPTPKFWGVEATHDEKDNIYKHQDARSIIRDNRSHIMDMSKKYGVDAMVIANVLYQEARHRSPLDDLQEIARNKSGTLGPGQMTIKAFNDMIDQDRLVLSPKQQREYEKNKTEFAFNFITNEKTGIEATAALIRAQMDRQHEWKKIGTPLRDDGNPNTLSLGQFVYGAALYSKGGISGDPNFDRKGPTTDQIDFKNSDLSGLKGAKNAQSMINAFRYLPLTYEALYGTEPPKTLGGYFNDRSILRQPDRRSSMEDGTESPIRLAAAQFGERGQPGRDVFERIAGQLQAQTPGLGEQKIAETSADLTQKALAARMDAPTAALNDTGRAFAYQPNQPSSPVVFSDPQALNPDSIARNAEKSRELSAQIAVSPQPTKDTPAQELEARGRTA